MNLKKKLPPHFYDIPANPDKAKHSKASEKVTSMTTPYKCLMVGMPGLGKTFCAQQLIMHQRPFFDDLIVVSPYPNSEEWSILDPTEILSELPDPTYFDQFEGRTCLVLEDFTINSKREEHNLSQIFRWVSTHSCGGYGLSVILCMQEYISTPKIVRRTANVFVLWPDVDLASRQNIEKRVGLQKGVLSHLYKTFCEDKKDSIMIDRTCGARFPIRVNLFTPIKEIEIDETN